MLAEKSPSETNRGEHSLCDIFVANDPTEHIPERKVANARTTGTTTTRFWCRALRASGGAGRGGGGHILDDLSDAFVTCEARA